MFQRINAHVLTLAIVAALPLASSCRSTSSAMAEPTVESTSKLETELRATSAQITTTLSALDTIVAQPEGDLRPVFNTYSRELSNLQSSAQRVANERAAVRSKAQAYYAGWEASQATITNHEIKESSEERRREMRDQQEEVNIQAASYGRRLDAFVTTLTDIHTSLQADLNSSGVRSIAGQVETTAQEGRNLCEDTDSPPCQPGRDSLRL